jgi:cytidyltransferase-like protein
MSKKEIVVAVSGFMDPLHIGHIEQMRLAKQLGDKLVVIVNNDKQAILKKGYEFMPFKERMEIIRAIKYVDEVFPSIDEDRTVCKSLEAVKPNIFAKGGDRTSGEIPESAICKKLGIKIVDGLGAKIQSSSDLVKKFKEQQKSKGQ